MTSKPAKMPKRAKEVKYLIVGSKYDTSLDLIIQVIRQRSQRYFRLNYEDIGTYGIDFKPALPRLELSVQGQRYIVAQSLCSVFFRAPLELGSQKVANFRKVARAIEHTSLLRALTIFETAKWINHPIAIYRAESKLFQLRVANNIGFNIPETVYTNRIASALNRLQALNIVMKSSDTLYISNKGDSYFLYSQLLERRKLKRYVFDDVPFTYQNAISPKEDIRVTVIGQTLTAVKILLRDQEIEGDWRLKAKSVSYQEIHLPQKIARLCFRLMKSLHLIYAGIDLIKSNDLYYFIEINPAGEWAWLQHATTSVNLAEAIAKEIVE